MKINLINFINNKKKKSVNKNIFTIKTVIKIFIIIIIILFLNMKIHKKITSELNKYYRQIQRNINLKFNNNLKDKIKIGIYTYSFKNGGLQKLTSLILKYFHNIKIYDIYIFTIKGKEDNEYIIPQNVKRIIIKKPRLENLINQINNNKIDILIYNFFNSTEIEILNQFKNTKIIFYIHQSIFYWIYLNYFLFKSLYTAYQKSKYIISLVPFENDYLFPKWGIRSILMNNFISYEFNEIIPSDLSSKIILMIGRAEDKLKRFELGIKAMKYIIKEIPNSEMKIISALKPRQLKSLVGFLNLTNNIRFTGYSNRPEIYFKNASLHIFPSISESFGLVLCETKIYGIPNILVGIDYLTIQKGGTIVIYDDNPESIAVEAIKILKNYKIRKQLGENARNSMKVFKNELIVKKWNKIFLSIYNGDNYYQNLRKRDIKISEKSAMEILNNQLNLLKIRTNKFVTTKVNDFFNFSYLEKFE